jgi:hypothetical protein
MSVTDFFPSATGLRFSRCWVLSACMVATGLLAQAHSVPDTEFWNEADLSGHVAPRITLTVPVVLRDSFSLPNPQLFGIGPLVDFAITRRLSLTSGYLFVSLPNTGAGYYANVPLAAITVKGRVARVEASDRNRAEVLFGIPQRPIRYRNKLALDLPFDSRWWQLFMTDEAFYDFSRSAWSQNRFQVGVGRALSRKVRLDLFYMERNVKQSNPPASHIIGMTLEIKFKGESREERIAHGEN